MELWFEARPERMSKVRELCEIVEGADLPGIALNEVKSPPDLVALSAFHELRKATKVVTSILVAFPRSPAVSALNAWHLQEFSKGRFELGLGTQVKGHIERRYGMEWLPPQPRLREYIGAVRSVWDSWQTTSPLNVKGQYYNMNLVTPDFNPGPIDYAAPPIHTSGVNEAMCRLGGEISDGVIFAEPITKRWTDEVMLPALDEGLAKSGRGRKDVVITGGGYVGVGETDDEVAKVRELIRYRIAFYSSTRTYLGPLKLEGFEDISQPLHKLSVTGRWDEMSKLVTDEILDRFAVIGRYDNVGDKLLARYGHFAQRVYVGPLFSQSITSRNLRKLADSIKQ